MAIYGRKVKLRGRRELRARSIYITLCTTCGQLMRAKNRPFWENIDLLVPCVTSVPPWRDQRGVGGVKCTNASACRLWVFNKAESPTIMTGGHIKWCRPDPYRLWNEVTVSKQEVQARLRTNQIMASFPFSAFCNVYRRFLEYTLGTKSTGITQLVKVIESFCRVLENK